MTRTWTEQEITDLIDREICETRIDYRNRFGRAPDAHELAENIYAKLRDTYLIQDTP